MSYSFPTSSNGFKVRVNGVDRMLGASRTGLESALWCALYLGERGVIEALGNPSGDDTISLIRWQRDTAADGSTRTTEEVIWEVGVWDLDTQITDGLRRPVWTGRRDLPAISPEVKKEVEEAWDPSF